MTKGVTFYSHQPDKAFWRRAVGNRHFTALDDLAHDLPDLRAAKVATAGSCFAQHIGRALRAHELRYMDYEPAPSFLSRDDADKYGYGVYSARYGNIYTVRQLWQLFEEAFGMRTPQESVWEYDGRYYDALRPGMEPHGFGSVNEVLALRASHLACVKHLFEDLDVFVFTMGLTEAWIHAADDTAYPISPGVIAGTYEEGKYRLVNFRYGSIRDDFIAFVDAVRNVNPKARFLLTVSPVPLAATATQEHVLVATTYSKSVLRAVAGDLAEDIDGVFYFPSYEIIASHPSRGMYYEPDLRSVAPSGVAHVMSHFFKGNPSRDGLNATPQDASVPPAPDDATDDGGYEHCEEALLDQGDDR